jgi:hypothetical protein
MSRPKPLFSHTPGIHDIPRAALHFEIKLVEAATAFVAAALCAGQEQLGGTPQGR